MNDTIRAVTAKVAPHIVELGTKKTLGSGDSLVMLWPEHILIGFLVSRVMRSDTSWCSLCIGSILPDVPMLALVCAYGNNVTSWPPVATTALYVIPHSLLVLPIVPPRYRVWYAIHIVLDLVSHTGQWGIQPFYPILSWRCQGMYDPWKYLME
jgi:hypothetical protein